MAKANKKGLFLEKLKESYGIIASACTSIGITRRTFYNWINDDPEFKEKVSEVMETQVDRVEGYLFKKISEGDTACTIFYLKCKGRNRGYGDHVENYITGTMSQDVKMKLTVNDVKAWLNEPCKEGAKHEFVRESKVKPIIEDKPVIDTNGDIMPPLESDAVPVVIRADPQPVPTTSTPCPKCGRVYTLPKGGGSGLCCQMDGSFFNAKTRTWTEMG